MSWDHEAPFILRFMVEAEHIDALEHTNNTQYVTWCNETAWVHTTELGLGAHAIDRSTELWRLPRPSTIIF
jgi:acyl-CoA thioester hydrolase